MAGWQLILTSWDFHPSVVIGCLGLAGAYLYAVKWKVDAQAVNFLLGVLVIFLALVSPIDDLGDDYLFSAHMMQHIMLGSIAPPLLVAGTPESFVRAWLKFSIVRRIEKFLSNFVVAMAIGVGTFWLWHYSPLYNATLENEGIHILEHLSFLVTGTILWWPVFKPISEGKLSPIGAIAYLFTAAFLLAILGIIFSLANVTFYTGYAHPDDKLGLLNIIRNQWGVDQLSDQKLGGAIMWAFGSVIYLWAMMMIMADWFKSSEGAAQDTEPRREHVGTK